MDRRTFLGMGVSATAYLAAPHVARAKTDTVRIGLIQPMSGNLSAYAAEGQPVIEYLIAKINAQGGIKSLGGAKIEAILADDASQPARTMMEARRLLSEQKVAMLAGTILTPQMMAVTSVIDEARIPTLSIWAGGVKSPYMFSIGFPYEKGYVASLSNFIEVLRKKHGFDIKTAAMVFSNYDAGQQVNKLLRERLIANGINVLGDVPLDTKAQDQTSAMVLIRSMKPDVVTGIVLPRDGVLLHQARFNLNYNDSLFVGGTAGYTDSSLWKELGPEIGTKTLARNLFGMTGFSPATKLESLQAFVAELNQAKLNITIGQAAIQAAQAVRVIQYALEAAGDTTSEAILKGFQNMVIPHGSPDLYFARPQGLKFGEDRMLTDNSALFIQWTPEKKQEVIFPTEFANASPRPKS